MSKAEGLLPKSQLNSFNLDSLFFDEGNNGE